MKHFPAAIYVVLVLLFMLNSSVLASPYPPQCICDVKIRVLSLKERPEESVILSKESENQTIIDMDIEVMSIEGTIRGHYNKEITCQSQYKVGQQIKIQGTRLAGSANFIPSDVKPQSLIQADIERTGGCELNMSGQSECFEGYELSKIRVLPNQ